MSSQLRLTIYAALATIGAAVSLNSVFSGLAWLVPVMGSIVLVGASCAAVRRSPLPSAFEPITAAIVVLCWVTLLFAHSSAPLGFIPGTTALSRLGRVARHGFTEIHTLPTPAPAHHGIVLLTVVGVAAIALVVDLMVVTLRRAALAGLPLLALFTVCAATGYHGVDVLAFVTGSIGYLLLLYTDNREKVARWGAAVGSGSRARPASAWSTDGGGGPAPAALGRRVGFMAISLAVVVPFLLPGLHTGIDEHRGGGDGGGGNVVTLNPIVSVANDLTDHTVEPVLTYRSTSGTPGYLRLTSLDVFDGTTFASRALTQPANATAGENLPVRAPQGQPVATTIAIADLAQNYLPAPATVLGTNVGNDWRYDPASQTIFSARTTTKRGLIYTTRSVPNIPTAAELKTAGPPDQSVASDLTLPRNVSPKVRALTQRITSTASSTYGEALALQRFFTTDHRFTYSTHVPADNSQGALARFLLRTRKGFCQQFATSMAVMARLSGIPARVAVGFTAGTRQADGSYLVTTRDAHAWPELWFQGYGWLAFEPTPRTDHQTVTPSYAIPPIRAKGGSREHDTHTPTSTPTTSAGTERRRIEEDSGAHQGSTHSSGAHHSAGIGVPLTIALLVLLLIVLTPGIVRVIVRQRRQQLLRDPAAAADAAWAELRDSAIDLRAPWDDRQTPRQVSARLLSAVGSMAAGSHVNASLARLVAAEEQTRYAATPTPAATSLRDDLDVVRAALAAPRSRVALVLAHVMPRSSLALGAAATRGLGELVSRVVERGARVRHAVQRRGRAAIGRT